MSDTDPNMTILLVDDDDVACEAVMRSFRKSGIPFPVVVAGDGLEALAILRGQHPSKELDAPYLVLLDLNMPRMSGLEFLKEMRADPAISSSVVFVLTTSNDDNDRTSAYAECIAGYMVKSAVGPQFSRLSSLLMSYQHTVTLPSLV